MASNGNGKLNTPSSMNNHRKASAAFVDQPQGVPQTPSAFEQIKWPVVGAAESLARRYGMDDQNLATRRAFIRLGEGDQALLAEWMPWARTVAPEISREFYDWQFSFPPTRQFFDALAAQRGLPSSALRKHLEAAQAGYLVEIFAGASIGWDIRYFEKRLFNGMTHDRIDLPFKWYVGSYPEFQRLLGQYLRRDIEDLDKIQQIEAAISRVLNLDLQAGGDAFILSTLERVLESVALRLEDVCSAGDKAEQVGLIRKALNEQLTGPLNLSADYMSRISKGDIPPKITDNFCGAFDAIKNSLNLCIDSLTGLIAEMKQMSDDHNKGDIDAIIPADKFQGAYRVMARGVNEMVSGHIAVKKKAMACVDEFSQGNFEAPLDKFPGKKAFINETVERLRANLKALISDTDLLTKAADEGKLGTRADAGKHSGDFRRVVEGINKTLEMIIEPLKVTAQNATTLASSSEELTAVSQSMVENADQTAVRANAVSAASEQLSRNVASVASASEEMQASIREIAKNANDSAMVAKSAVETAATTNDTMKKLGDSSREIGNVIKVITSIAQQTNLLALNATIEAARAGEAGKGFAVVANEVKELAKQTAKATEEISQKIEAIQSDTKGAVVAIDKIGSIIDQINDISNSIASAVEEQTVTTNEIGRSVGEAAMGVNDIAKNISAVASSAMDTTQGANDSKAASLELSKMAARLQAAVARYTF